ncbi:class I SAM-dependent methyltransferase [Methylomonas sp. HYX-M1]|uniref:class I SAM-dependent methyltransferase n=1 Tax=Methylomonas sp. HYX-M1 TaxID=3139307 RepID=UPI00345BDC05
MSNASHQTLVAQQFGSKAQAYRQSSVHVQGEDLDKLVELVAKRPEASVLDVGCGAGHVALRLAPQVGRVIAYDLSRQMLAEVSAQAQASGLDNLVTQIGSASELPFADATFDIIVTRYSAHHWQHLAAGLREMRRVLKPGGSAVIVDVISPGSALLDTWLQTMELLRDPSHVRDLALDEWLTFLQQAGFGTQQTIGFKIQMEFTPWLERMNADPLHGQAIRSLQQCCSSEVADYFRIDRDGNFWVDTALIAATTV